MNESGITVYSAKGECVEYPKAVKSDNMNGILTLFDAVGACVCIWNVGTWARVERTGASE